MYRPKYFSFIEMIHTASTSQENNLPDWDDINRLLELCRWILDPVREMYGKPIVVTSGFRSSFLNRLVGGVSTSQHLQVWLLIFVVMIRKRSLILSLNLIFLLIN